MLNGERLAITTGSKNRLQHLMTALKTWTKLAEPDVIIVVDWGSEIPVYRSLLTESDPRIVVVRTEQEHWQNSRCHNLEFQVASRLQCDLVLRLDNDTLVSPRFFEHHPVRDTSFYAVNCHNVPPEQDDKRNLCGTVFAAVRHWRRVNGYSERLNRYGYEDEDFYNRLKKAGLSFEECRLADLEHLPHSDETRLSQLCCSPTLSEVLPTSRKNFNITLSRQIAQASPWTLDDHMTSWSIQQDEAHNLLTAKE